MPRAGLVVATSLRRLACIGALSHFVLALVGFLVGGALAMHRPLDVFVLGLHWADWRFGLFVAAGGAGAGLVSVGWAYIVTESHQIRWICISAVLTLILVGLGTNYLVASMGAC